MKLYLFIFLVACVVGCGSDNEVPRAETSIDELVGIAWEISHYTANTGIVTVVSEETKYQIRMAVASFDLEAFIGCVNFSNSYYELNDGYLKLRLGASNDESCNTDSFEFAAQSVAIFGLLQGGGSGESLPLMYSVIDDQLTLEAADGRLLRFIQVAELMRAQ